MAEGKRIDRETGTPTVGHEWDGIEELDTPMPRWWLWTLYATIVWAIGYTVVYPAWPMLEGATKGAWNWSSRDQLQAELQAEAKRRRVTELALAQLPIERLPQDSRLLNAAVQGGAAAFKVNCVQCHGSGAAGTKGYPNLNDDDWLWGGDLKTIHQTLQHGIREPGNGETRVSMMPAFGRDGLLKADEITAVAAYVSTLSGAEKPTALSQQGASLFATNCAACHGSTGKGNRSLGAPNLSDQIWLYGGDRDSIAETITNSRGGIMPSWDRRLDPVTVKMLAAYVHSLGGGEKFVADPKAEAPNGRSLAQAQPNPAGARKNEAR